MNELRNDEFREVLRSTEISQDRLEILGTTHRKSEQNRPTPYYLT